MDLRDLEKRLLPFLRRQRWFAGKARAIASARVWKTISLDKDRYLLGLVRVKYEQGLEETYLVPMRGRVNGRACFENLDATHDPAFHRALLELFQNQRLPSRVLSAEQSNTSVIFGSKLILKLFRRLLPGPNPEVEISGHLTNLSFPGAPSLAGFLEFREGSRPPLCLAALMEYVPNQGDAFRRPLDGKKARLLGRRLAELHAALQTPGAARISSLSRFPAPGPLNPPLPWAVWRGAISPSCAKT